MTEASVTYYKYFLTFKTVSFLLYYVQISFRINYYLLVINLHYKKNSFSRFPLNEDLLYIYFKICFIKHIIYFFPQITQIKQFKIST